MESSGEDMKNNTAWMTLGGDSRTSVTTFRSDQVREGKSYELNMKWQGKPQDPSLDTTLPLDPFV